MLIPPKVLRVLQEQEFERLRSTHTRKVNVRLVAATNRDLEEMIAAREFRSDLYYRLNVFPIRMPPLRERKQDIPLLVSYFVQKFAKPSVDGDRTAPLSSGCTRCSASKVPPTFLAFRNGCSERCCWPDSGTKSCDHSFYAGRLGQIGRWVSGNGWECCIPDERCGPAGCIGIPAQTGSHSSHC